MEKGKKKRGNLSDVLDETNPLLTCLAYQATGLYPCVGEFEEGEDGEHVSELPPRASQIQAGSD